MATYEEIVINHYDHPVIMAWHEYQRKCRIAGIKLEVNQFTVFRAGWDAMVEQLKKHVEETGARLL